MRLSSSHRVDFLAVVDQFRGTVAFEREVVLRVGGVDVLNGNSS